MEEADKVSSAAPDGAPRDIIMNEAAAVALNPADEALRSAEHSPQNTSLTNLTTAQITSAPQMTEETNTAQISVVTDASQTTEETSTPTEVTSASQTTEEASAPQMTEITSAPQMTEITSTTQTTEVTSTPQVTEETITPQMTEVTSTTQTAEVTSAPQMIEETSAPQMTEETSAPQMTEEAKTAQISVVTDASQTTEETSTPTEVTSASQTTEEASAPQMTEITSTPQVTEETITPQITEITSTTQTTGVTSAPQVTGETITPLMTEETSTTQTAEVTSAKQMTEETSTTQTAEVTSAKQMTEETSAPQMTEEAITPQRLEDCAPQMIEESLTTQPAEISSTWQITEETSPPEPAEDSFTPAAAPPETAGAPPSSSCEPQPREERAPREEEEEEPRQERVTAAQESTVPHQQQQQQEAPRGSHPAPESSTHTAPEHPEPSPSHEPDPSVAPALLQFPSDRYDSPPVALRASASLAMDPLGHKDSAAFDPDLLSQSDDDFMFDKKKSPFQGFSPVSDGLEESTSARRSQEVSESPSPDLVQDAYDEGHAPSDELKQETDANAPDSLSYTSSDLYSNINIASDDRPTALPDILKSSPLNPEKLDSGSSEGSPDFSPVHRSVDDSPNSPFPANNPFGFDSKILLLKEMADETEAKAVEKAKLEVDNNSEQSFTAFDLVKETDVPLKSDGLLKDKEVISLTEVQTADRFECLYFSDGNTREPSDSESPSADSFSPVLDAVPQEPSEQDRRAIQGAMDTAEEASEQEASSEEFEFVERPPRGVAEEFLEMQDSLAFSKPSEMLQDEDRFPKPEPQEAVDHTLMTEDADKQSHLLTQVSDKPSPARGKAGLESDFQEISPAPVIRAPADKPGAEEKEAESSKCDLSAATVLDLLYWRDVKASGLVFGCSLLLLLSLLCCSIISVLSYSALALLCATVSFRTYRGVLQAVQKSDEGHPFKRYLDRDLTLSGDVVQRHSEAVLTRINGALKELRRLFLVEDLIDSLKFAVFLWVLTYVGAWFNGLTLLLLGLLGAFSGPLVYERHQTQIDQVILSLKTQLKDVVGQIQAKVPGAQKKSE